VAAVPEVPLHKLKNNIDSPCEVLQCSVLIIKRWKVTAVLVKNEVLKTMVMNTYLLGYIAA
jgi:hypothetical protein